MSKNQHRTIACLNARLEASKRNNIKDVVQGKVHDNNISIPENVKPKECVKSSVKDEDISKNVHAKDEGINSLSSNAAKFASIIKKYSYETPTEDSKVNLNRNRFSELSNGFGIQIQMQMRSQKTTKPPILINVTERSRSWSGDVRLCGGFEK